MRASSRPRGVRVRGCRPAAGGSACVGVCCASRVLGGALFFALGLSSPVPLGGGPGVLCPPQPFLDEQRSSSSSRCPLAGIPGTALFSAGPLWDPVLSVPLSPVPAGVSFPSRSRPSLRASRGPSLVVPLPIPVRPRPLPLVASVCCRPWGAGPNHGGRASFSARSLAHFVSPRWGVSRRPLNSSWAGSVFVLSLSVGPVGRVCVVLFVGYVDDKEL